MTSGELSHPLRQYPPPLAGSLYWLEHDSAILTGNRPGDPTRRRHPVYLPPGYADSDRRYPVLWSLAAYTSAGPGQVAWRNHGESLPQRVDRLIRSGEMAPVIIVFPDAYTALGGNQYVNTPAIGNYADYLIEELVPAADSTFRTVAEARGRAVFGKSSGGFGALHLVMAHPGYFAAAASHAGDCGFDRVYLRDFAPCCDVLARYGGDVEAFVRSFWRQRRPTGADFHTLMTLCLAATYSPSASEPMGLELPFDLRTCRLNDAVWERWLAFDPVYRVTGSRDALSALVGLWTDVGRRDQYFIHYGSRDFHDRLSAAGIAHHYEEFDGTHSGIDWRFDHSLPWLARCLLSD
jgi:S-formylglutathione hydrolase FrmB